MNSTIAASIAALALLISLSSPAHEAETHFDLQSYNGNYEASGFYCGVRFEFSDTLLVTTPYRGSLSPGTAVECVSSSAWKLYDCDPGTGHCESRLYPEIKIILLRNGDFIVDNPNNKEQRYTQFSKFE